MMNAVVSDNGPSVRRCITPTAFRIASRSRSASAAPWSWILLTVVRMSASTSSGA